VQIAWDPYTARDINQLDKVQRRAARFIKNDYRRTTSVSGLVRDLGWQTGSPWKIVGRILAWLFSIKVFMASLQFYATHFAGLFVAPDTLILTHLLYFLLVLTAISFRFFLEPFQNGISYRRMFAANHLLFLFVLPS